MKIVKKYKKFIFVFVIVATLFSSLGAYAAILIGANEVAVTSSKTTKTTVQDSLDELYDLTDTRYTDGYNAGIAEGSAKAFNPSYTAEYGTTNMWGQSFNTSFVTPSAGKIKYTLVGTGKGSLSLQFNGTNQVNSTSASVKTGTLSVGEGVTVRFGFGTTGDGSYGGHGFAVFYTE